MKRGILILYLFVLTLMAGHYKAQCHRWEMKYVDMLSRMTPLQKIGIAGERPVSGDYTEQYINL